MATKTMDVPYQRHQRSAAHPVFSSSSFASAGPLVVKRSAAHPVISSSSFASAEPLVFLPRSPPGALSRLRGCTCTRHFVADTDTHGRAPWSGSVLSCTCGYAVVSRILSLLGIAIVLALSQSALNNFARHPPLDLHIHHRVLHPSTYKSTLARALTSPPSLSPPPFGPLTRHFVAPASTLDGRASTILSSQVHHRPSQPHSPHPSSPSQFRFRLHIANEGETPKRANARWRPRPCPVAYTYGLHLDPSSHPTQPIKPSPPFLSS
ncbi:hypothetical protein C8R45DRAFT_994010 [Mycena sanguinolenta]|nr:hypothetical protein C8R45DRAFT_994010 [Mycena sanguinolenta]